MEQANTVFLHIVRHRLSIDIQVAKGEKVYYINGSTLVHTHVRPNHTCTTVFDTAVLSRIRVLYCSAVPH